MSHPLDPMVLHHDRTQDAFRSEARGDALQHQGQAFTGLLRFRKQCLALLFERMHVDRQKFEVADRRQQLDLLQMLGEQARQMLDVTCRLRRSHRHLTTVSGRLGPHRVMAPAQGERVHAVVPGGQPAGHLQHQAPGAEQQCRREFDPCHQLQLGTEGLGEFDPGVRLGAQPVGLVKRGEQLGIEATAEPATRERSHLSQVLATQPRKRRPMGRHRGQGLQRQRVQQLIDRLGESIRFACTSDGDCCQARGRPAELAHAQVNRFFADALDQASFAAEEPRAGLDLHHDGRRLRQRFDDCDAGCELKAPGRKSRSRVSAP